MNKASSNKRRRPQRDEGTTGSRAVLYCYYCGSVTTLGGSRQAATDHISDEHKLVNPESWVGKKEHPDHVPIFRSVKKGEQLFADQVHRLYSWWYPVEDLETRRWEYVGPIPEDPAYRVGPPDPLPPGVERRPRQMPEEEYALLLSNNINAKFISEAGLLIGNHCKHHPRHAAELLAVLGFDCSEAQVNQIGEVARSAADTFFADPSTPLAVLRTMLQALLIAEAPPESSLHPPGPSSPVGHHLPPQPSYGGYTEEHGEVVSNGEVGYGENENSTGLMGGDFVWGGEGFPAGEEGGPVLLVGVEDGSSPAQEPDTTTTTPTLTGQLATDTPTPTASDEAWMMALSVDDALGDMYSLDLL